MLSDEVRRKYYTDDTFHAFAKTISKILIDKRMSLNEIQQAIDVAVELYHEAIAEQAKEE